MRGYGTVRPGTTNVFVRWNGSPYVAATLVGDEWSVEFDVTPGMGDMEVADNLGRVTVIKDVKVGRVIAGAGQSNMLGSTLNFFDESANTNIAIHDARPSPHTAMVGRVEGQKWGPAYDKGFIPSYLALRQAADGGHWGFSRFAVGSTVIAWWEPTAAVDAGSRGFALRYYDHFVRGVVESQGFDPDTYDPATDGPCCEEVFIQIGETDARSGTSKAAYKASLSAIAAQLKLDLGSAVVIRVSILQDLFTTGYVDTLSKLTDIQDAVRETAAADSNVVEGPDYSDYVLDLDPPETNGNVHFYQDKDVAVHAARWI